MRARLLPALLLVVLLAVPVLAQVTPIPEERVGRVIEALLIWRLVDELELTDQQIARIFPRIKALKNLRLELGRRKRALEFELRQALAQRPQNREAIRIKVAQLQALRIEIEQRRQRILRQIGEALTLEQQGKFVLIAERFEAETLRQLEEIRRLIEQQQSRQ